MLILANSQFYFANAFERYDVWVGFEEAGVGRVVAWENFLVLIGKLNPPFYEMPAGYMPANFFSERDIFHMQDVQAIFKVIWCIAVICMITLILIRKIDLSLLAKLTRLWLGALILIAPIAYFNWERVFTLFHQIFFSNNYWLLDPSSSNLIKYFMNSIFLEIFFAYLVLIFLPTSLVFLKIRAYASD